MHKTLSLYVPELLASYERVGGLNNRDSHNMPSKRAVGLSWLNKEINYVHTNS